MNARVFRVILPVSGIEEAAVFYGAILGHPGSRVSPGRHYFRCGDVILACYDPVADGDSATVVRASEPIYLAVPDVEDALRGAVRAGATPGAGLVHDAPMGEIGRRPWGEVSVYLTDPFGNVLCFVEEGTEFTG